VSAVADVNGGRQVVVIGAGPAGLTAAHELTRHGVRPVVLEKEALVGGLARTESYRGFHFDLGGHRFFTKVREVQTMWREVLGEDFIRRPRLSRIYYAGRYFHYPLRPWNAIAGLGPLQALLVCASYLRWQIRPHRQEETFEQWVTNRFGRRLYRVFFKTYTEKVWGVPCSELKAEWAAQRIKDLSLRTAVLNMFLRPRTTIRTLIDEFDYPRRGPGMMWAAVQAGVEGGGGTVRTTAEVVTIHREGNRIRGVTVAVDGRTETVPATDVISSMPITELVARMDPPAPGAVRDAAAHLTYRDFLTVCLIVRGTGLFPDNWIYVHDPGVRVGRIQNFGNWSPDMVPDPSCTSLGLEYFCTEGDEVWRMPDAELVALGAQEVERIGLARAADVVDGCVVRVPKAYPVYDASYRDQLAVVRDWVDGLENLQTIGRNGLHRYNNQDHAMLTGMLAVRNLLDGETNDLWSVNTDQEYHEEIREPELEAMLSQVFSKLDRRSLGTAVGAVSGVTLALLTMLLVVLGGSPAADFVGLLGQYFPGYAVSAAGVLLGLLYGFAAGFAVGWTFALARNTAAFLYERLIRRRAEAVVLRDILDYV
jgi:protoporphyrinogen oxidase